MVTSLVESKLQKEEIKENDGSRIKRDAGLTAAIIGASISAGASLVGTTVGALKRSSFSVAVSGSISNYAKWGLQFQGCDVEDGHMNIPLMSVASGQREGFAGHKVGNTAKGNFIKCTFLTANNAMLHFMYSAPYSFDFHVNTLAAAICPKSSYRCRNLDALVMYYGAIPNLTRREYYNTVKPLKICNMGLCIIGGMGTSHQPEISFKVYPSDFDNLSRAVKDSSVRNQWNKADYNNFVSSELR